MHRNRNIFTPILLIVLIICISNAIERILSVEPIYLFLSEVTIFFLIIAFLIIREAKNLDKFHIDKLSIITFIVLCFLRPKYHVNGEIWFKIGFILLGLVIGIFSIKNWKNIPSVKNKYVFVGLIVGLFNAILAYILLNNTGNILQSIDGYKGIPISVIIFRECLTTMSSAVIYEEMMFRGFLWGYLNQAGLKDGLSCIFQAVFFWLLHVAKYGFSLPLLLAVLFLAISTTAIVRYSRQVFPAIIIHTMANALTNLLLYVTVWR
jgi:membrane protease YdiL (CAAX protease family)